MTDNDHDPWVPRKQWPWWLTLPYALATSAVGLGLGAWRMSLGPRSIPWGWAVFWGFVAAFGVLLIIGVDRRIPDRVQARLSRGGFWVVLAGVAGFIASFYLTP